MMRRHERRSEPGFLFTEAVAKGPPEPKVPPTSVMPFFTRLQELPPGARELGDSTEAHQK